MRVPAYRLTVPSGGTLRVRKADRVLLAACGLLWGPLLSMAVQGSSDDDMASSSHLETINRVCGVCILDAELDAADLTWVDRMAVYQWALEPTVVAPARRDGWAAVQPQSLAPLVTGDHGLLLDAIACRYHMRPSALLQLNDSDVADDFDMALAYRALTHRSEQESGDVEVEDMYGGVHKVPRDWLPDIPQGSRAVNMDSYAKTWGAGVYSAGGIEGGDGKFGPQPGKDGQRKWQ